MNKANRFRQEVIKPVLNQLNLGGDATEELLLGTAVQESLDFTYRQQQNGPALGYYQMEPRTHDDIWQNFLHYRPELSEQVTQFLPSPSANKLEALENNDNYATAMARVFYLRVSEPLPPQGEIEQQANYWKQHYNTPLGKGKPEEYIEKWNIYVLGV